MDEGWRRAERAWRADEDDPQAVELALAAARRARQPVPLGLWDRRRSRAREFTSTGKFVVLVEREGEEDQEVGGRAALDGLKARGCEVLVSLS